MKISHDAINGHHETVIEIGWFAQAGTYLVRATGYGDSLESSESAARLLLGQARAQLIEMTTREVE